MQFQVPQFIETEDKIIGPLTMRQFGYVGAGGLISAMLYFTVQTWLFVIGSFIVIGLAIGLAFVKIQGRPFINVVLSAVNFYWKPQTYVWQQEHRTFAGPEKTKADNDTSALEEILASSTSKEKRQTFPAAARKSVARSEEEDEKEAVAATPERRMSEVLPREAAPESKPITRESVSSGDALHKSWEDLQTGAPLADKNSDKQFLEKKMAERYQIFSHISGERNAAKRVDYR